MKLTLIVQDFEAEAIVSALKVANNTVCEDFARIIEAKVERHNRRGKISHNERVRIYENNRYHKRREAHECTYCGAHLPDGYKHSRCEKCLEYSRNYNKEWNKRRFLNKLREERQNEMQK